jgi:hypothetical protein
MSVVVPIVHEQDSSLGQVFHSLGVLESVVLDVFASVVARTGAEKQKLVNLNARVRTMGLQIAQVASNKQHATCVTSPAKFPSASSLQGPLFTPAACQEMQAHTRALPLPSLAKESPSLPSDVSELFWALDHSRQSLRDSEVSVPNSDKALSSVSSLVPFGSKQRPEPLLEPKKTEVLGPQPLSTTQPVVERRSLLFPRSHAAPPSLGMPTNLPLPKLASTWVQSAETKALTGLGPSPIAVLTELPLPVPIAVCVQPVRVQHPVIVDTKVKESALVMPEIKEEKKAVAVVVHVEKKEERPVVAPVIDGRSDLLREIERRGREKEQRAQQLAEQQQAAPVVRVHVAPVAPTPSLLVLPPTQDEALRRAMEGRRRDVEEDDIWADGDDI